MFYRIFILFVFSTIILIIIYLLLFCYFIFPFFVGLIFKPNMTSPIGVWCKPKFGSSFLKLKPGLIFGPPSFNLHGFFPFLNSMYNGYFTQPQLAARQDMQSHHMLLPYTPPNESCPSVHALQPLNPQPRLHVFFPSCLLRRTQSLPHDQLQQRQDGLTRDISFRPYSYAQSIVSSLHPPPFSMCKLICQGHLIK